MCLLFDRKRGMKCPLSEATFCSTLKAAYLAVGADTKKVSYAPRTSVPSIWESRGATAEDSKRLGGWISGIVNFYASYLMSLPITACLAAAGFNAENKLGYCADRHSVACIMPFLAIPL